MANVVVTDYGVVKLSKKTLKYLAGVDPKWHSIKGRSKHAAVVRNEVARVEQAVMTLAAIEWNSGGVLEEV